MLHAHIPKTAQIEQRSSGASETVSARAWRSPKANLNVGFASNVAQDMIAKISFENPKGCPKACSATMLDTDAGVMVNIL